MSIKEECLKAAKNGICDLKIWYSPNYIVKKMTVEPRQAKGKIPLEESDVEMNDSVKENL